MKILFAASEAAPFIKTGGLGDVAGALPAALAKEKDTDVRVILPYYKDIPALYKNSMVFLGSKSVPLAWRMQYAGLFSLAVQNVTYYFVDNEFYFNRRGIYGFYDDGERFAFFAKSVLELMPLMDFYPDILHVNDWQTALSPLYLDMFYRDIDSYKNIRTVLSVHNIEFQGRMDKFCIGDVFGIPKHYSDFATYKGDANMLKAGIEASNRVVTVSPSYADEILDPYFACGLEDILRARRWKISGILNGIDTEAYNPLKDKALFQNYSVKSIAKKAKNKSGLQNLVGLPESDKPLIGMITRLTSQKGIDLVLNVIHEIMGMDLQMVILGMGDHLYEVSFKELAKSYHTKLAAVIGFSGDLANKIYAGADFFLMPSKFEPCGLAQMISMRYGTLPIVRETGGLKDTVVPFNPQEKTGVGFTFKTYNAHDMLDAIRRATDVYHQKENYLAAVTNAMNADMSWSNSAKQYIEMYKSINNKEMKAKHENNQA
jgi:starch synthase